MSERSVERGAWLLPLVLVGAVLFQNVLSMMLLRDVRRLNGEVQALSARVVSQGNAQAAPPTLESGQKAPEFAFPDTDSREVSLASYKGQQVLLVFSSPTCRFCKELYPELRRFAEQDAGARPEVLLLQLGAGPEENRDLKESAAFGFPVLAADRQGFVDYRVPGTPFLVLVDEEGVVRKSATLNSYEEIVEFVST